MNHNYSFILNQLYRSTWPPWFKLHCYITTRNINNFGVTPSQGYTHLAYGTNICVLLTLYCRQWASIIKSILTYIKLTVKTQSFIMYVTYVTELKFTACEFNYIWKAILLFNIHVHCICKGNLNQSCTLNN